MKYDRTYNFSAGPAMMPEEVLEEIRDEMMNYRGSGMCVMEMSHRSKVFDRIAKEAEADLREVMGIPDNYKVLFVQGGGTLQFAMVPMNLMKNGKACYVETGTWSKKAIAEAKKYGEVVVLGSSKDKNFTYIPQCAAEIPADADYVYICENETINGTTWNNNFLSYKTHADSDSMYNTPNCWAIYCCGKVFKYLKKIGGLSVMAARNQHKAAILYDYLESSKLFQAPVRKEDRSLMNVTFTTGSEELDAAFVAEAKAAGFDNLKGHRSVGGLRASIYNAMPEEGVAALVEFCKKFEASHQ